MAVKKKPVPLPPRTVVYPRTDPALLRDFDPRTKLCMMNCGQAGGDPRSREECMYQCDDCAPVILIDGLRLRSVSPEWKAGGYP